MDKARGGHGGIAPRCAEWFRPPKPLLFRGGVWGGGRRCGHTTPLRLGPAAPDKSRCPSSEEEGVRSEEHTSELQSLMRISYAVFCLKKKKQNTSTYSNLVQNPP